MNTQQQTIKGIATGDKKTLTAFYTHNFPAVKAYVHLNKGKLEDAEDVFQEALVLIYQKLNKGELQVRTSIHAYCFGVCKNIWRNRLKSHKLVYGEIPELYLSDADVALTKEMERMERDALYRKYFMRLNSTSRQIWKLFFEGKNTKEVATLMGATEGYVRKAKFDSKKKLLEMIECDPLFAELKNESLVLVAS